MARKIIAESLPPVVVFVAREVGAYTIHRRWGEFDSLHLRALDDLFFDGGERGEPAMYGFSSEPPHGSDVSAFSLPLQVALERVYFHISEPERLVLNPRGPLHGGAIPLVTAEFSVTDDCDEEIVILRDDIPELLGALATGTVASKDLLARAEQALYKGLFFEAFSLARKARERDTQNPKAWFFELFSYSFFGKPEDALALYEEYPAQGDSNPHAQLLAARYRLLLSQLNESRTILHVVSFDKTLGALASCELARSFLVDKQLTRALDAASLAISKDTTLTESYLVRGLAQRAISYESGDREGLHEAYKDFQHVATQGGYNAAEALYHAGTVCARLGALTQAETLFRQSLFQRSRLSPRDALIRILCAEEKWNEAKDELAVLERLAPQYGATVAEQIAPLIAQGASKVKDKRMAESPQGVALWGGERESAVTYARETIMAWGVPITRTLADYSLLDDFINRFAPDGDFPKEGEFSQLDQAGAGTVARALALHLGGLLVERGSCAWGPETERGLTIISVHGEVRIPIENFVKERILLGASGDNFSSLESLVVELHSSLSDSHVSGGSEAWWITADEATILKYAEEAEWAKSVIVRLGVELSGSLSDLAAIDDLIDAAFEPGGGVSEAARTAIGDNIDRFISGVGFLVGEIISKSVHGVWYTHERAEGISLVAGELGRIFPVARLQRRVFLASAADFATKLGSLAWSVAVASVTEEVRAGSVSGQDAIKARLIERLPTIQSFPEHELNGVVDSLIIGAGLTTE